MSKVAHAGKPVLGRYVKSVSHDGEVIRIFRIGRSLWRAIVDSRRVACSVVVGGCGGLRAALSAVKRVIRHAKRGGEPAQG